MVVILTLWFFLFGGNFLFASKGNDASLCGISLRPSSARLLHDVEHRFGKPVRCELATYLVQAEGARANERLDADGTPLVKLDSSSGRTETEVVHELFHLQLRARGFPQNFAISRPPAIDGKILEVAAVHISGMLEHRLFYPNMRKMGFGPTKAYREELENHMAHDQPPPYANRHPELLAIDYATVVLVINDPALSRRVRMWYEKHGWQGALSRGRRLANYVLRLDPNTPQKMRAALAGCLETVFGNKFEIQWLPGGSVFDQHERRSCFLAQKCSN